jgi:regulatory protein
MRTEKMKAAMVKACNYCAYQERTQQEVRDKLYDLGLFSDEVEDVLSQLITANFVNEERYAKAFASGKFRLKRWGRQKILFELKRRKISPCCTKKAMLEIPQDAYEEVLQQLIEQKSRTYSGNAYTIKNKIARYLINKGYECELVWAALEHR